MADAQITVLGMSGAGKTCYLLGLYYKMASGMNGYTLSTDDDTDVQLRDRYAKICDCKLGPERFPAGTDDISKYEFDLQYGYNTIMSFDWVDYPGGVLDRKNNGDLDSYENLKKAINKSSTLFIFVDGSLLIGEDHDDKVSNVKDNCSSVINSFFSDYKKSNNQLPPTAIIVSKYDMCNEDTKEEELIEIIREAFSPFFVKDDDNIKRIVTVIPVSIGNNIMDDNCSGKLKPRNIHLPIFMGIWFALSTRIQDLAFEIQNKSNANKESISDLMMQKAYYESRFFKKKDEIKRLAKAIKDAEIKNDKQSEELKKIISLMERNSDKLLDELNCIPYVYLNDERKTSFSDIF